MAKDKSCSGNEHLSLLDSDAAILRRASAREIRQRFNALEACLGKPAFLTIEKIEDFDTLFNQLLESVIPTDAIEYMYIRDAAILTFDINRLQQSKIALLKAAQPHAVTNLILPALERTRADSLASAWAIGNPAAISQVNEILKKRDMKQDAIEFKAIELRLTPMQQIENMIYMLENRRFRFFKEIDRHRDSFKRDLQEAVKNADGSYSLVDAERVSPAGKSSSSSPRSLEDNVTKNDTAHTPHQKSP